MWMLRLIYRSSKKKPFQKAANIKPADTRRSSLYRSSSQPPQISSFVRGRPRSQQREAHSKLSQDRLTAALKKLLRGRVTLPFTKPAVSLTEWEKADALTVCAQLLLFVFNIGSQAENSLRLIRNQ